MADLLPIGLQAQAPKVMTLGEMMNTARLAQDYQQLQQMNPISYAKAQEELARSQMETETKAVEQSKYFKDMIRNAYGGLLADPDFDPNKPNPKGIAKKLEGTDRWLADTLGVGRHKDNFTKQFLDKINKEGEAGAREVIQTIRNGVQQGQTLATQGAQLNAPAQYINTGQMAVPIYQSPYQSGGPGRAPVVQMELPPTTQLVARPGDQTGLPPGTPYLLGPQGPQRGVTPEQMGRPYSTGQAPAEVAATQVTNADWADTSRRAADAQQRIGIFQNIKKYAPDAFTGVGGARKELAAGVLNAIGIPAYEAEKISTEELAKNSALLALAGGNTDAARALAEVATPNKKLNEKAIKDIANQMIGIEKMAQAKAQFLGPVSGDQAKYQERLAVFNQVADPRLFQESTPEDVAKMKARMSPAEIRDFGNRVKLLKQMGLTQ